MKTLSKQETKDVNGGCQIGDCGQGPIIIVGPKPKFPRPPYGDPRDQDNQFPF